MSLISSGEFICFACDSSHPCEEEACRTRQIYVSIIWGLSVLIFTTRLPIIYYNYIKTTKPLSKYQTIYRLRRKIIFFNALFTALVACTRSILQAIFSKVSLSVYILSNTFTRLSSFGGLVEVLAILITWIQLLQACNSLKTPNNNFLYKIILYPYILFSLAFIVILALCERILPSSTMITKSIFNYLLMILSVLLVLSLMIAGIRLYLLLRKGPDPNVIELAHKVSYFVFLNIGFLFVCVAAVVIMTFINVDPNILVYIIYTCFMIFITFSGISMSLQNSYNDKKEALGLSNKTASNERMPENL